MNDIGCWRNYFLPQLTQELRQYLIANQASAGGLTNAQIGAMDLDSLISSFARCECGQSLLDTDSATELHMFTRLWVKSMDDFWRLLESEIRRSNHQCGAGEFKSNAAQVAAN